MNEHPNDLKQENIDGKLNVYVVEYWTNKDVLFDVKTMEYIKDTPHVACFTTFNAAYNFCLEHTNYGGEKWMKEYHEWHWKILRRQLNQDPLNTVSPVMDAWHFTPDMEECNINGTVLEAKNETLEDRIEALEEEVRYLRSLNEPIGV